MQDLKDLQESISWLDPSKSKDDFWAEVVCREDNNGYTTDRTYNLRVTEIVRKDMKVEFLCKVEDVDAHMTLISISILDSRGLAITKMYEFETYVRPGDDLRLTYSLSLGDGLKSLHRVSPVIRPSTYYDDYVANKRRIAAAKAKAELEATAKAKRSLYRWWVDTVCLNDPCLTFGLSIIVVAGVICLLGLLFTGGK